MSLVQKLQLAQKFKYTVNYSYRPIEAFSVLNSKSLWAIRLPLKAKRRASFMFHQSAKKDSPLPFFGHVCVCHTF